MRTFDDLAELAMGCLIYKPDNVKVTTKSGSVYEVDTTKKQIRRLNGKEIPRLAWARMDSGVHTEKCMVVRLVSH